MSKDVVEKIYQLREDIIILGLTGRTGSGCSTVANILEKPRFDNLDLRDPKSGDFLGFDERQYEVLYNFMKCDRWKPFDVIEVSSLILALILQEGKTAFIKYLEALQNNYDNNQDIIKISDFENVKSAINSLQNLFDEAKSYKIENFFSVSDNKIDIESLKNFYLKDIKKYKQTFKATLKNFYCKIITKGVEKETSEIDFYSFLFQNIGNNLRSSGECYKSNFDPNGSKLLNLIDFIIRVIIKCNKSKYNKPLENGNGENKSKETSVIPDDNKPVRICIDALRNQYEIEFLRDKYKAFYALSINVEDCVRKERLSNLNSSELAFLDKVEYPNKFDNNSKIVYHQNIQSCIEVSDIHIYNPPSGDGKFYVLTKQLLRYLCLLLHPGIVTPTQIESCMQLAYTAKMNSGCLSRKVGSVITGEDFSIKAVGWNEVPDGQIPCNLRNVKDYIINKDSESFSKFELEDERFDKQLNSISNKIEDKLCGLPCAYCFKDIYNAMDNNKNQVHTRSLHAEENAFLQLAKYGGMGIRNGKLFVTASPCELCSKKSYQLGIKEIYYIDPYPGISESHILSFGNFNNPKLFLFNGAIGSAYISLYSPKISLKDEIALMMDVNSITDITKPVKALGYDDITYNSVKIKLKIESKTHISLTRTEDIKNNKLVELKYLHKKQIWSGSNYYIDSNSENIKVQSLELKEPFSYEYDIVFDNPIKAGNSATYTTVFLLEDLDMTSLPQCFYKINNKTKKLCLELEFSSSMINSIEKVFCKVYADAEKLIEVECIDLGKPSDKEKEIKHIFEKPNLFYRYSIEWEYKS